MLKKMLSIIMAAAMIFGIVGCGSMESPETSVTNYLNAVKNQDAQTIAKYTGDDEEEAEEETEDTNAGDEDFAQYAIDKLLGSMEYEIISSEEKDDTAAVTVSFTNVNMTVVVSEMMSNAISLIFSGMSDEEMNTAMQGFFITALENHEEDLVTKEATISLKKGDGYWIVENGDDLLDAATGGIESAFSNIG